MARYWISTPRTKKVPEESRGLRLAYPAIDFRAVMTSGGSEIAHAVLDRAAMERRMRALGSFGRDPKHCGSVTRLDTSGVLTAGLGRQKC